MYLSLSLYIYIYIYIYTIAWDHPGQVISSKHVLCTLPWMMTPPHQYIPQGNMGSLEWW